MPVEFVEAFSGFVNSEVLDGVGGFFFQFGQAVQDLLIVLVYLAGDFPFISQDIAGRVPDFISKVSHPSDLSLRQAHIGVGGSLDHERHS